MIAVLSLVDVPNKAVDFSAATDDIFPPRMTHFGL
jgi:hypothetical protein